MLKSTITYGSLFLILFFFYSCAKKESPKLFGKWKVGDVGMPGMEITYEFVKDTLIIERRIEKYIADSLQEKPLKKVKEIFFIKGDSSQYYLLEVYNPQTDVRGDYKINIEGDKMILIDFQGETFNLERLNQ